MFIFSGTVHVFPTLLEFLVKACGLHHRLLLQQVTCLAKEYILLIVAVRVPIIVMLITTNSTLQLQS
jgi:hypothetical protein